MSDETNPKKPPAGNWRLTLQGYLPKTSDEAGIKLLIWILLGLVLGLNVLALVVYAMQKQLVDYFDSKSYEALLATLLIPLLLSFISRAFKIDEKLEAEQKQLEQEKKELLSRLAQEKRKKQIETIEKTNAMWSELYSLSTEVAYFKTGQGKVPVREMRKRLECFTNSAEEVVNLWYLNFSNIPGEVQNLFLPGVNLLLLTAMTVADVVEAEEADAKHLQNCLLVIQDGVRGRLHYSMMQIFNFAMEGRDADLQKQIDILRFWGEFFKEQLKDLPPNLPPGDEAEVIIKKRTAFKPAMDESIKARMAFTQFEDMAAKVADASRKKQIQDSPEYNAARTAYDRAAQADAPIYTGYRETILKSPSAGLGLSRKRFFSNDQIKKFMAEMYFQNDVSKIETGS